MRRSVPLLFALSLFGCGDAAGDRVQLDWNEGETFHLSASYRMASVKGEVNPVDLSGDEVPTFDEMWSDEVVWTYQVVESGLRPSQGDELYAFALTHKGEVAPLAVLKASIESSLNTDPELIEADPVIYLVFREDRDRMAGLVSFVNVNGERVEHAYSTKELGRSWSALSQSMLTAAPTYLAPFAAGFGDAEITLEDGSLLTTESVDNVTVDVFYDDVMGGGLVASRYEEGQPWPTWTVTDNVEIKLMNEADVDARRQPMPFDTEDGDDDFDYLGALSASIDIESALVLDAETLGGGWEAEVRDGYKPWAGYWWSLKRGDLIWGYQSGADTFSGEIRDDVDAIKNQMDALSAELRDMDSSDADYESKREEYRELQSSLVDQLVAFYGGLLSGLDGGTIRVEGGTISHSTDGWSYDLDELSPMDKMALQMYFEGETSPNPFYLPAWEILNSYNPGGESWWGHCNGWAAAAILTEEPTEDQDIAMNGESVNWTVGDLKGLLTEAHYSTYSRFYGQRYNGPDDDVSDLTPAAFHKIVTHYIKNEEVPLVFDITATEAVWNYPAWRVSLDVSETTTGSLDLVNINTADSDTLQTLDGIGPAYAGRIIDYREAYGPFQEKADIINVSGIGDATFADIEDDITVTPVERTFDVTAYVTLTDDGVDHDHVDSGEPTSIHETYGYTLVTDVDGLVLRGEWDDDESHPDFAWVPYNNPMSASSGSSENPYLPYGVLLDIIGEDYQRQ